jgi:glycerol-3-phosphate dehydrogenase (NAD(P)+)
MSGITKCGGIDVNITVVGAGAWGTALAISLSAQHRVTLWARKTEQIAAMQKMHVNRLYLPEIHLPANLLLSSDLTGALADVELVMLAVPVSGLRDSLQQLAASTRSFGVAWLCKGFEAGTGLLPHQVVAEVLPKTFPCGDLVSRKKSRAACPPH